MTRNEDSLSIECCYLSDDGSFTQETYDTLIHTLAWLIDKYDLTTADILRHYDCGGKLCPCTMRRMKARGIACGRM